MSKALRRVAFVGDITLLRTMIPDATADQKAGALRRAVDGAQFFVVCELLRSGTPVNNPVFISAVRKGLGRIVESMLAFGAHVNATDTNGESALMIAIRGGCSSVISVLLEHKPDVTITDVKLRTALYHAVIGHQWYVVQKLINLGAKPTCWSFRLIKETIEQNNISTLRLLLKAGADPNEHDLSPPPVVMASKAGLVDMVHTLIEAGADVNKRLNLCKTALMWAAEQGDERIVTALIKAGANVNAALKHGHTAIMWAAERKHEKVVRLLVEAGANLEMRNAINGSALSVIGRKQDRSANKLRHILTTAIASNKYRNIDESYFPVVELSTVNLNLWKQLDEMFQESDFSQADDLRAILCHKLGSIDGGDRYHRTVLMFACAFGLFRVVRVLLSFGASVHIQDRFGMDALMWAVIGGNAKIVELLLHCGSYANIVDNQHKTSLHHALGRLDLQIITLIMKAGGRLQSSAHLGEALIWSAKHGHSFIAHTILSVFANPNVVDQSGGTPLIWASANGHIDCVWLLLRAYADPNVADRYRKRALFYALDGGHFEVFTALLSCKADANNIERDHSALCLAARLQRVEFVRLLLKYRGVQNHVLDREGFTPLMHACRTKNAQITQLLLDYGGDPNVINSYGDTALVLASRVDAARCVKLLVKKNADIEARGKGGRTALLEAASLGNFASVFALLVGRAEVDALDDQGKSALDLALPDETEITLASARVVQTLVSWGASSPNWKKLDRIAREFLDSCSNEERKTTNRRKKRVRFGGVDFIRRNRRKVFV